MIRDFNKRKDPFLCCNRLTFDKVCQATGYKFSAATGFLVLAALKLHNNNRTSQCYPSQQLLASELNMTRVTIVRAITALEENGILFIVKEDAKNHYFFPIEEVESYFLLQQQLNKDMPITNEEIKEVKNDLQTFENFMIKQGDIYEQAWTLYKSRFINMSILSQNKVYQIAQNF